MGKVLTNIQDIKDNIKWQDIFELQIIGMPNEQKLTDENGGLRKHIPIFMGGFTESVAEIGFGDDNDIFVIFQDWNKGKTLDLIDDEYLSKGMRLIIADRDGTPIGNYIFEGCTLISKVPIILGYDNTYIVQRHPHILVFKYSNIYKILN